MRAAEENSGPSWPGLPLRVVIWPGDLWWWSFFLPSLRVKELGLSCPLISWKLHIKRTKIFRGDHTGRTKHRKICLTTKLNQRLQVTTNLHFDFWVRFSDLHWALFIYFGLGQAMNDSWVENWNDFKSYWFAVFSMQYLHIQYLEQKQKNKQQFKSTLSLCFVLIQLWF